MCISRWPRFRTRAESSLYSIGVSRMSFARSNKSSGQIDPHPAAHDHGFVLVDSRSLQVRPNARHEFARHEWLDYVVVRACSERVDDPVLVGDVGEDDERHHARLAQ